MATKRGRANARKVNDQINSARGGQAGRGYTFGEGVQGGNSTGSQKPDPGAYRRTYHGEKATTSNYGEKPGLSKKEMLQSSDPRISSIPAQPAAAKKKAAAKRKAAAPRKIEASKKPQGRGIPRVIPRGSRPRPVAAKPETTRFTPKRPDNYVSAGDRRLLEGIKKKKKRKAPTYRG